VFGADDDPTEAWTSAPEDPGPLCFPPVAAAITSGARLLLALLERAVIDAGGAYAFCDTDSMGIVARPRGGSVRCPTPDGTGIVRALSRREVREILGRFDPLNPYDRDLVPSLWKVEHDSVERPLTCYAISAKRYVVYRQDQQGRPEVVRVVDAPEERSATEDLGSEAGGDQPGFLVAGDDRLFGEAGDDLLEGGPNATPSGDEGNGGSHVVGDRCVEIETPTDCEL